MIFKNFPYFETIINRIFNKNFNIFEILHKRKCKNIIFIFQNNFKYIFISLNCITYIFNKNLMDVQNKSISLRTLERVKIAKSYIEKKYKMKKENELHRKQGIFNIN